jgi:hypothetical protein
MELIQLTFSTWRTYQNQSADSRIESEITMKVVSYHAKAYKLKFLLIEENYDDFITERALSRYKWFYRNFI